MQQLEPLKALNMLEKAKVPISKYKIAKDPAQAAEFAKKIGFPVALKILSKDIIHKTDVGGVAVNINSEEQARTESELMLKKAKVKFPKSKIDGILVQRMESGVETIVGFKRDPQFGPVIMFGIGGIFVEIMKDTSLRIAPVSKNEALEMINEIRSSSILTGARGKKPVNIDELANIIVKASKIAEDKKILELDFNPVIVNEKSAMVVDARMMIE